MIVVSIHQNIVGHINIVFTHCSPFVYLDDQFEFFIKVSPLHRVTLNYRFTSTKVCFPPPTSKTSVRRMSSSVMTTRNKTKVASKVAWTIKDLEHAALFARHFVRGKVLGKGGDGVVTSYTHLHSNDKIAVKTCLREDRHSKARIKDEIEALMAIGKHENIATMITYCKEFDHCGPAIISPLCDLGDLYSYHEMWYKDQTRKTGKLTHPAEATVLKLFRDIALGLDYLHNGTGTCYVHSDLKPENILVLTPADYTGKAIPTEPIFKITDFARLTPFPNLLTTRPSVWHGTFEFAPPSHEWQRAPEPSGDIWCLGATIQTFALNVHPTVSRIRFTANCAKQGIACPALQDKEAWGSEYWREKIPVVYRPLNLSAEVLIRDWDVQKLSSGYRPYSFLLNEWYASLFQARSEWRITSADLKRYIVPVIERQLAIERALSMPDESI
jgi:serine/threonine protein kinase